MRFVDMRPADIVEDMNSSKFLAANSISTYICYMRVGRMMTMHQGVLLLLERLVTDASVTKTLGVTHLDDPSLDISSEQSILLMIPAADKFVKNDHKAALFHTNSFYWHARALLGELHLRHFEHDDEKLPTFVQFLDTMI